MKTILLIFSLCLLSQVQLQAQNPNRYEYAQVHAVKGGIDQKAKIQFSFGSKYDSAKIYEQLGTRNIVDAIELMEDRGWELINIMDYGVYLVAVSTANFRRKRSE